jgi:hypothetical protein
MIRFDHIEILRFEQENKDFIDLADISAFAIDSVAFLTPKLTWRKKMFRTGKLLLTFSIYKINYREAPPPRYLIGFLWNPCD